MRFSRIELINWKNFHQVAVDLPLRVFLVGPNASGKSNFLDAFRFLRDLANQGGLQSACKARGGIQQVRFFAANQGEHVAINVTLYDETTETTWIYEVAFTQQDDASRTPIVKSEVVKKNNESILSRPDQEDLSDPLLLTQTALEQVSRNQQFRFISDFFSQISYLHLVPQFMRNSIYINDPNIHEAYGGNFLKKILHTDEAEREERLGKILDIMRLAIPQLEELKLVHDFYLTPNLQIRYQHWRPDTDHNETLLSDGTLRLLALLWLLQEDTDTILLEEPELSLQPALVRQLASIIHRLSQTNGRKRQTVISTHNPELLSDESISGHEVLIFEPSQAGTHVYPASDDYRIRDLLKAGLAASEVVLSSTEPKSLYQINLL